MLDKVGSSETEIELTWGEKAVDSFDFTLFFLNVSFKVNTYIHIKIAQKGLYPFILVGIQFYMHGKW